MGRQRWAMAQAATRAALKVQLQAQGLWDHFKKARDAHQAAGATPREAREKALRELQFLAPNGQAAAPANGPADTPSTNGAAAPATPPARRGKRLLRHEGPVNLYLDVMWVYVHLPENTNIRRPPSPGALALLEWARRHSDQFFKLYLAKFITEEGWRDFVYQLNNWFDNDEFVPTEGIWDFVRPLEDHEK